MSKLLRANMMRLWKDKIFRFCFLLMTVWGIVLRIGISMDDLEKHYLEETFWIQAFFIGIILAVFVSLFVGAEYSEGTIRNKIISGHTRFDVYLSNVFVCMIAGWLMCLGCLATSLLVGIPTLGFFHMELWEVFMTGICVFALCAAYAAIYCCIVMLCASRAVTVGICTVLAFLMLFAGTAVSNQLEESEYYYIPDPTLAQGEIDDGSNAEWVRNPNYPDASERDFYEKLLGFLPGGQSLQLSGMLDVSSDYTEMLFASCAWVLLSAGCGLILFRKKDLK